MRDTGSDRRVMPAQQPSRRRRSRLLETPIRALKWFAGWSYRTIQEGWNRWSESRARVRRTPGHPEGAEIWLNENERRLLEALAATIMPSDEIGPGAGEAGVVATLDRLLAASPSRQGLYARGLAGFDAMSQDRHSRRFADLTALERVDLLREIGRLSETGPGSDWGAGKILAKLLLLYRSVRFPVVQLFPVLVDDVMRAFYTSPVSWKWLGYDGPPMPQGYLDLAHPRPNTKRTQSEASSNTERPTA